MNEPVVTGMEHYELFEGDTITVGCTHQIEVGRDKSWVKYEATTKVRPNELSEETRTRAIGHVNESVMRAVAQTVDTVRRFNA